MKDENIKMLFESFIYQLNAPKIDKYSKAEIISRYMIDNNLSQRELGRLTNIPHNTIQDWLLPLRIDKEEYNEMQRKMSVTDIYKSLRESKKRDIRTVPEIMVKIVAFTSSLKTYDYKYIKYDDDFIQIMDQLKKAITYFEFKVESKNKKE